MKKLLCGVLIVVMMLSLVACGNKLSGTYESSVTGLLSYTFEGSKVTFTVGSGKLSTSITGTYKIDGDTITLTWGDEKNDKALSGEQSFEKTDDGIKIGGVEFTKK